MQFIDIKTLVHTYSSDICMRVNQQVKDICHFAVWGVILSPGMKTKKTNSKIQNNKKYYLLSLSKVTTLGHGNDILLLNEKKKNLLKY